MSHVRTFARNASFNLCRRPAACWCRPMTAKNYVVCAVKPWNIAAFHRRAHGIAGAWHLIESASELTVPALASHSPRYVFFPHWSWRVPKEIVERFECVCFHMTDVPFGRGGSPLQNLVVRGHTATELSALRMVEELDAGPVYLKRPLSLDGRAEDIFERAADLTYDLIDDIVGREPAPTPQVGEVVVFPRRTPQESEFPAAGTPESLYNFIRMLDAPTYPKAFIEWGGWRIEFDRARVTDDAVEARVLIKKKGDL
jgi:methionyl-tRNA formyltransferase